MPSLEASPTARKPRPSWLAMLGVIFRCCVCRDRLRHPQMCNFSATLLDLCSRPTFVFRNITLNSELFQLQLPDDVAFFTRREVKEERTQCERSPQFWGMRCNGITSAIHRLRPWETASITCRAARSARRFIHKRILRGCEVKSDCWHSRGITRGLTRLRFCCSGRAKNIVPSASRSCIQVSRVPVISVLTPERSFQSQ